MLARIRGWTCGQRNRIHGLNRREIQAGELLFASLLRERAARQLAELTGKSTYAAIAAAIGHAVPVPLNCYQNGAYWGTPTGWVCFAIAEVDEPLARRLAGGYMEELREGDCCKGRDFGSPWECQHPDASYRQNAVYMTSVPCPPAAFRRLGWTWDRDAGATDVL